MCPLLKNNEDSWACLCVFICLGVCLCVCDHKMMRVRAPSVGLAPFMYGIVQYFLVFTK